MKRFEFIWKSLWSICLLSVLCFCSREEMPGEEDQSTAETVAHDMIVLGAQLEDPYSVKNIQKALDQVYPTRGERHDVTPTDRYVRFLPAGEEDYNHLQELGLDLMDHPLDYQILRDGDYYHDPTLQEDEITWQYAVVPKDFQLPYHIHHEILDECFIPEHDATTRSDGMDWERVVRASYRLTGNADLLEVEEEKPLMTQFESGKGIQLSHTGGSRPKGRITIEDERYAGGKPIGVSGVKVVCNSFVKFSSSFTDRDGYYEIPRNYSSKVRYRLMFRNKKEFSIGFNLILIPASMSALGKGSPEGIDVNITKDSNRNLFCRSVVNNAVYDYISSCEQNQLKIDRPPTGTRIWIMQKTENSSAVMLHHGALTDYDLLKRYVGVYATILKIFLPDITIGADNRSSYSELYSVALHECAHASHFNKVGTSYWDKYIAFILRAFVHSGNSYGNGTETDAGYCEVGEMWAFFVENVLMQKRYGGAMPETGQYFWFHPQIFQYLYFRGFSVADIFDALGPEVSSLETLEQSLRRFHPDRELIVRQAFDRFQY